MAQQVRVGVIGTGFGVAHVELFQGLDGVEVVGVCSAREERAREVAGRFGLAVATSDHRDLLREVDAVVIATPPGLHAPMALDAAAAGVHVFCEKPLAASVDEARAMRDAVQAAGIVHATNFQMRFAAPYARAKELVGEGYIGKLAMLDARVTMNPVDYLHLPLWSTSKADWFTDAAQGGGLLGSSAGPHLVDLVRWLGGPVAEVAARTITAQPEVTLPDGATARVGTDDGFLVLVRFESGAVGTVRGVPVAHKGRGIGWEMELNGDAGSLVINGNQLRGGRVGDDGPEPLPLPEDALDNRIVLATRFIDAIRTNGPAPAPSFQDGLEAQAVLDASLRAARSGEWVEVEATA